jgi:DNA N-6-adenine-methyltransferase (Dam)
MTRPVEQLAERAAAFAAPEECGGMGRPPAAGDGLRLAAVSADSIAGVPLTAVEATDFDDLERVIERGLAGFVEVGRALESIRDKKLYRETHGTFEHYLRERWGMSRAHAYRQIEAAGVAGILSPIGDTPATEAVARELAPVLHDQGEAAVVEVWREMRTKHGDRLTAEKVRRAVADRLSIEQKIGTVTSSASAEYYTPARYVDAAREVLGGIDLDPASCVEANETVRARRFYDARTDGLTQPWEGRVWCNPPYGREGPKFVAKALREFEAGSVPAAVLLLSGYSVDTAWFAPLWEHVLCFVRGWILFRGPTLGDGGGPTAASVFVYLGPDWPRFAGVFGEFGSIVARWTPGERHVTTLRERREAV